MRCGDTDWRQRHILNDERLSGSEKRLEKSADAEFAKRSELQKTKENRHFYMSPCCLPEMHPRLFLKAWRLLD